MLLHSFVSDQLAQQFSILSQMEKIPNNPMKWENKIDQVVEMAVLQKLGVRDTLQRTRAEAVAQARLMARQGNWNTC